MTTSYQQNIDQALFALAQHARHTLHQRSEDAERAAARRVAWAERAEASAETPEQAEVAAIVRDADPSAWYDLSLWYGSERMQSAAQAYRCAFSAHRAGCCFAPHPPSVMDWRTARSDERLRVLT